MREFKVRIPQEEFAVFELQKDNLPGVIVVNTALKGFEPKMVFSFHLTLKMEFEAVAEEGMPTQAENAHIEACCDELDRLLKGPAGEAPNALLLARITWNGSQRMLWRVFDPERADAQLQNLITTRHFDRNIEFEMEPDADWELANWYLDGSHETASQN